MTPEQDDLHTTGYEPQAQHARPAAPVAPASAIPASGAPDPWAPDYDKPAPMPPAHTAPAHAAPPISVEAAPAPAPAPAHAAPGSFEPEPEIPIQSIPDPTAPVSPEDTAEIDLQAVEAKLNDPGSTMDFEPITDDLIDTDATFDAGTSSMLMWGARSDVGCVRSHNEDSYLRVRRYGRPRRR